LANRQKQNQKL